MSDKKISALPLAGTIGGSELVPVVQGGATKQIPAASLFTPAVYTDFTLLSPFTWDSAGDSAEYYPPGYAKVGDGVRLRGKVTLSGTHADNSTVNLKNIARLPVGYWPTKRKVFTVFWDVDSPLSFGYCFVLITTDGYVFLLSPHSGQTYPFTEGHIALDQIWFDLA